MRGKGTTDTCSDLQNEKETKLGNVQIQRMVDMGYTREPRDK